MTTTVPLTTSFLPFQEAACAYVLLVTAVYWVSEAVPLGAAALVPAFLYPFFGVLRSSEVRPLMTQPCAQICWTSEGGLQVTGGRHVMGGAVLTHRKSS